MPEPQQTRNFSMSIAWLRERFFGTWDRALSTISIVTTVVVGIASLLVIGYPATVPGFIIVRDIFFWLALILLSLITTYRYVRRETMIDIQQSLLTDPFGNPHEIVHSFRDELFAHYLHEVVVRPMFTAVDETTLNGLCRDLTYQVRLSLLEHFKSQDIAIGDDVAVSVKFIATSDEVINRSHETDSEKIKLVQTKPAWILTVYRDHHTYTKHKDRERGVSLYDIDRNTVFRHTVRLEEPIYVHDDLQSLGVNYENENPAWRNYYNATIAVPICYRPSNGGPSRCYGVLTADSLNRKKVSPLFNTKECRSIMEHAADILAVYFLIVELVQSNASAASRLSAELTNTDA